MSVRRNLSSEEAGKRKRCLVVFLAKAKVETWEEVMKLAWFYLFGKFFLVCLMFFVWVKISRNQSVTGGVANKLFTVLFFYFDSLQLLEFIMSRSGSY